MLLSPWADIVTTQRAVRKNKWVVPKLVCFPTLCTCGCMGAVSAPADTGKLGRSYCRRSLGICTSQLQQDQFTANSSGTEVLFPAWQAITFFSHYSKERNCSAVQEPLFWHVTQNPSNRQLQSTFCLPFEQVKSLQNSSVKSVTATGGIWKHQMLIVRSKRRVTDLANMFVYIM